MIAYHTLENLEFRLGDAELAQVGRCEVIVSYDVDQGQKAITDRDPGSCQEGIAPSAEIYSVRALQDLLFAGDDLPDLCIVKGSELSYEDFIQSALDDIEAGILQDRRG